MPTKHIDNDTWAAIEKKMVAAVTLLQHPVKESELLRLLIRKGLETVTKSDLERLVENVQGGVIIFDSRGVTTHLREPDVKECIARFAMDTCRGMVVYGTHSSAWNRFVDDIIEGMRERTTQGVVQTVSLDGISATFTLSAGVKTIHTIWDNDPENAYKKVISSLMPQNISVETPQAITGADLMDGKTDDPVQVLKGAMRGKADKRVATK